MAYSYNIDEVPPDDVPCIEHDIRRAKKFLQKRSMESGDSLYDHLTELLAKILAEQPHNVVDIFEEYSRKLKEQRFKTKTDHLQDLYIPPVQYDNAKKLIKFFQRVKSIDEDEKEIDEEKGEQEDKDEEKRYPDMLELMFYFEQTGVGLPRHEMVLLNLSIRKLISETPLVNIRFWGKILGKPKSYYIVEAEFPANELARRLEQERAEEEAREKKDDAKTETELIEEEVVVEVEEKETVNGIVTTIEVEGKPLQLVFPPLPVTTWQPPTQVPAEQIGSGTNKKVYFVCNSPGLDEWVELPPVTPQQIVIARQIVRYCTGNLEAPIYSFPSFPGTEKNYLRSQIARISATTHISPVGFFTFGEEDEEEEMEEMEENMEDVDTERMISENPHYDPLPIKDLVDPSMSNWCHHSPYILKQGRTVWWNPEKEETVVDEEFEEEEEEEEEDKAETIKKEIGPSLLTPLSEDTIIDSVLPWTARQSSFIQPDTAVVSVRSNIWPGAFAFTVGKRFANIYIGWGNKYNAYNYSPSNMPPIQDQYIIGPEVMELCDPTVEKEEAYRIARLPPPAALTAEEEEMLDEEEEEDDDDDDDADDNDE